MTKRRRYAAAAAIGKRLYVVGGYDGRQRMNSVECLDLSQENAVWQPVASLTYRRGNEEIRSMSQIFQNLHVFFLQHFLVFVFIKVNSSFFELFFSTSCRFDLRMRWI